jgi:two-component system sensor histidine kinase LytS
MNPILLFDLMQRMSLAAVVAFVLSQTSIFRRIIYRKPTFRDGLFIIAVFGVMGIFGTYAGVPVYDALANIRVVGVMVAGFIGGPIMGIATGLLAGGHRYFLGGFTAMSCALSSVCEGLLAGLIHHYYPRKPVPWWLAFMGGLVGEAMQMGIILLTAKPYELAYSLVTEIALPMILVNASGIAIIMLIIKTVMDGQDKMGAEQSQKALNIAAKTLPYLRRGLNAESALATAHIIYETAEYDAVAVTDSHEVLAYVGAEASHHAPHLSVLTQITRNVLTKGHMVIAQEKEQIGCTQPNCKLASAVVVPLVEVGKVVGTLKLYYTTAKAISQADVIFGTGLAQLFSTQLELTEIDRQAKLASRSELKALYAQINPHFLFNTLNTITSLVRTQPDQARDLLLKLASMFRFTLHNTGKAIPLIEELAQVEAYLKIEQARHGDKLSVIMDIDHSTDRFLIPSLTIQPIVENAIKHGLQPKEIGGEIIVTVKTVGKDIKVEITDNGVGMDMENSNPLECADSECIGLMNVHERLRGLYGKEYGLNLSSKLTVGTKVSMQFPQSLKLEANDGA